MDKKHEQAANEVTIKDVSFFGNHTLFPSHYWATLHPPLAAHLLSDTEQDLSETVAKLSAIQLDTNVHNQSYFEHLNYNKAVISPSTRTCSSLLSEMLKPHTDSRPSSPGLSHDLLSDHGSISTHSTPPCPAATPPKRGISFLSAVKSPQKPALHKPDEAPRAARHISFAGMPIRPVESRKSSTTDVDQEATPVAKRPTLISAQASRAVSECSDQSTASKRCTIRFAAPPKSVESSRRSSVDLIDQLPSPVIKPTHATCKSTLDSVLRKEALAIIDTVPEENDDNDDNDENDDEDSLVASDDDGYVEDIESEGELDDDIYPVVQTDSGTPKTGFHLELKSNQTVEAALPTPVYRTAAPLESDLPDTTDFAPGTLDEDQPACVAFNTAVKDREARRKPTKPQDIDPTFPDSGSESEEAQATIKKSPCVKGRWNSPPVAGGSDLRRARSLPRRYQKREKPLCRAMTIKQSNEQKAQRRREKKEIRHLLRGKGTQGIDHHGHEKMQRHACARALLNKENPCVIRPVMSI